MPYVYDYAKMASASLYVLMLMCYIPLYKKEGRAHVDCSDTVHLLENGFLLALDLHTQFLTHFLHFAGDDCKVFC